MVDYLLFYVLPGLSYRLKGLSSGSRPSLKLSSSWDRNFEQQAFLIK
jgi:hypothetical protein